MMAPSDIFIGGVNADAVAEMTKTKKDDPQKEGESLLMTKKKRKGKTCNIRRVEYPRVTKFLEKAMAAYKSCGQYLQKRLPLANPTLMTLSAIDPDSWMQEAPPNAQSVFQLCSVLMKLKG